MTDRSKAYLVIAATALYVISPLDLVPDIFLGAGQLDDILLGILAYTKTKPLLATSAPAADTDADDLPV